MFGCNCGIAVKAGNMVKRQRVNNAVDLGSNSNCPEWIDAIRIHEIRTGSRGMLDHMMDEAEGLQFKLMQARNSCRDRALSLFLDFLGSHSLRRCFVIWYRLGRADTAHGGLKAAKVYSAISSFGWQPTKNYRGE